MESKPSIVVLGSINVDSFLDVKRIPAMGETLQSEGFSIRFGGKVGH